MNRKIFFSLLVGVSVIAETAFAQISGGIDDAMMQGIKNAYKNTSADKAIRNALNANSIQKLAVSADQKDVIDGYFSDRVYSRGVTDQKASGRCWLFTGLNVFRAKVIDKHKLPEFEFPRIIIFFTISWRRLICFFKELSIHVRSRCLIKWSNGCLRIR